MIRRIRGAVRAFDTARAFGRGRLFSAWIAARYTATGWTGGYRIYSLTNANRLYEATKDAPRKWGDVSGWK